MSDDKVNVWAQPQTIIGMIQIGEDLAVKLIPLFKKPAAEGDPVLPVQPGDVANMGIALDDDTLALIDAANAQP